jgi:hypothetical protein
MTRWDASTVGGSRAQGAPSWTDEVDRSSFPNFWALDRVAANGMSGPVPDARRAPSGVPRRYSLVSGQRSSPTTNECPAGGDRGALFLACTPERASKQSWHSDSTSRNGNPSADTIPAAPRGRRGKRGGTCNFNANRERGTTSSSPMSSIGHGKDWTLIEFGTLALGDPWLLRLWGRARPTACLLGGSGRTWASTLNVLPRLPSREPFVSRLEWSDSHLWADLAIHSNRRGVILQRKRAGAWRRSGDRLTTPARR